MRKICWLLKASRENKTEQIAKREDKLGKDDGDWDVALKKNELELELIQTQMAQKPMLRAEVYARALRASQNRK